MRHRDATEYILDRLRASLDAVTEEQVDELVRLVRGARNVLIFGRGRSGFVGRALAVRLSHLGIGAFVVGESITPPVREGDLVILISGSGETFSVVVTAQAAKEFGCKIVLVTAQPGGTLGKLADVTITLPLEPGDERQRELAPLGTLFEDACMIFMDGFVADLMHRLGETEESMRNRHANVE